MLPPLIGATDLPTRSRADRRTHRVAGVLLAVLLVLTGAVIDRYAKEVIGTARHATRVVPDSLAAERAPEVDLPDPGRLPLDRPVPVRTGRVAPAELRCRAWTSGDVTAAPHHPVVARPGGGAHCRVTLAPSDMVPGRVFSVQLVRVDPAGAVVGEYRPVTVRWSYPDVTD